MAYYLSVGALVGLASGLAMAALGVAVLRIRPRNRGSVAFSAFALLWGLVVSAANISQLAADPPTALGWVYLTQFLLIPLYLPLLYFVAVYPAPSTPLGRSTGALLAAAVPAAVLLLLYAASPGLLVAGADLAPDGLPRTLPGPLNQPVQVFGNIVAFNLALLVAARNLLGARGEAARSQLALVVAAFLAYLSYRASDLVNTGFLEQASNLAFFGSAGFALRFAAEGAALASVAGVAALVLRRRELPWRDLVLACAVVPFLVGALEPFVAAAGITGFATVGVWRLAMVGLFAYAIARYRLFDLEVRLQGLAPWAAYGALTAAGLAALWMLAGASFVRVPALGLFASVGVAAVCVPAVRAARFAVGHAAPQLQEQEYLYKRKIDVYRAALEEAEAKGAGEQTEQAFLTELRRSLGISQQEHRLLLLFLRSQQRFQGPASKAADGTERFRIERELGSGSFGRAVLAHDTRLDRKVVLKQPLAPWLLEGEGRVLFLQEARLAARIHHPNVVAVHEVLPDAVPPVLVLEYVEGGSLEDLLGRESRLEPGRAVAIALDVLAGLEQIHRAGIVHRDVKPANILLDGEGRAKVTDFGIARPPKDPAKALTLATAHTQPGSLAYMSPEQARGEAVDARTDLYAVGAVLYRCLAGQHYLDLRGHVDFRVRQLLQQAPPRLPAEGVSPALEPMLLKALAKDPEARYATAAEMATALRSAAAGDPRAPATRARRA